MERISLISSPQLALEDIVKKEIQKLPNYSKQIFNPNDSTTDFYNWYLQNFIPIINIRGRF